MKKMTMTMVLISTLLVSCAAAPAASNQVQAAPDPGVPPAGRSAGPNGDLHQENLAQLSVSDLTEDQIAGLLYMREEEKLARDVYLELAEIWDLRIFSNIASSEARHMEAVLGLIEQAGLEDPAQGLSQGEFLNQDLQALYDDLTARGGESIEAALLVGAAIEEIDILDLQETLAGTEDAALRRVYESLLSGSTHHLGSFVSFYERQTSQTYQPQFLSDAAFQGLLADSASRGGGGGRGNQPRGRGQAR